ncbi:MAG: histidinol-phosphatase, partial [Treponema sp.]|nr:histidinol-phosphatase [Treponema sp.]
MSYLYETHLHTVQGSACGVSRGRDYIKKYRDLGFTGIMVTDHFFNGNTAIDRKLPWKQWVGQFLRGYEETRNEGEKIGLDVFFGWEETYKGDDYLVYGLD